LEIDTSKIYGSGAFGVVNPARRNDQPRAVKCVDTDGDRSEQEMQKHVSHMWTQLSKEKHSNIVELKQAYADANYNNFYYEMPVMEDSIEGFLGIGGTFEESTAVRFFCQMVEI
jgi:hypothetical protein